MEQLVWIGAPYWLRFMSTDLPAYFWVLIMDSQIHLEIPIIDLSMQETWADISPMTYACVAIENVTS